MRYVCFGSQRVPMLIKLTAFIDIVTVLWSQQVPLRDEELLAL